MQNLFLNNYIKLVVTLAIMLSVSVGFAQNTKVDIRPYTIQTTYNKLKKYYNFISPITQQKQEGVLTKYDIVYKSTNTSDLKLDVFYPSCETENKYPGLLLVHGGGWVSGVRDNLRPLAERLAAQGYVAVTASYRLAPEAIYPAAILDLKDALRWMRSNANDFCLDPERIATLGASAGAQLAMQLGVTSDSEVYKESDATVSSSVQAIVNIDGVASFVHPEAEQGALLDYWLGATYAEQPELWAEASPLEHVTATTPPTLFVNSAQPRFHAGRDSYIEKLDAYRIYNEVYTLPDTPHAFWLVHPWFDTTAKYIVDFLDKTLKKPFEKPYRIITVAKDGSAEFKSIQEAIFSVRAFGPSEVEIHIKNGVYREKIIVPSYIHQLTLIGESQAETIITYDDYAGKRDAISGAKLGTFNSYTMLVLGGNIRIENLTIQNSSCNEGQAVALHVEGDRFVAKQCRILGCQDTLYTATDGGRQYYYDCFIEGTTDFIFGQATVVFDHCVINSISDSYITAAATPRHQDFGFVFFNCKLTAKSGVEKVYLGRPWRPYAKTIFINSEMWAHILPQGWHAWPGDQMFPHKEQTVCYGEYNSFGLGAAPKARVSWSKQLSDYELKHYTFKAIFRDWLPEF
ncbi:pectinesterase family protein [Formosa sp. A9]|uniref:pectinesterase family protein n=1 Tax=Formosa sp. A9 TaxID=3442641 RepID=UPI003EBC9E0D